MQISNTTKFHENIEEKNIEIFVQEFIESLPENYEVVCENTAKQALSYSLQARKLKTRIEESRKEIIRPHIDFQKSIMKFAKDFYEKLDLIELSLKEQISDWMKTQKENPFDCFDEIEVEDGKISMKKFWDFEIENPLLIPHEFLKPDEEKIKKYIASGIRNIPGIKIFKYESAQMRVKN